MTVVLGGRRATSTEKDEGEAGDPRTGKCRLGARRPLSRRYSAPIRRSLSSATPNRHQPHLAAFRSVYD